MTLAVAAIVAALPGAAPLLRDAFGFQPDVFVATSWSRSLDYFLTNVRCVMALLLAAWARPRSGSFAPALDLVAGATVTLNAAGVGLALGAYGLEAGERLVHLPIEWAALALATGAYVSHRRAPAPGLELAVIATRSCMLLAGAAVLEEFGSA